MSGTTSRRQLVAERARQVRNGALCVLVGLLFLALLRELLGGQGDEGAVGQVWGDLLETAVIVAVLAQAGRAGARVVDGLHQPADRRLPTWGQIARLVFRLGCTVAASTFVAGWGMVLVADADGPHGLQVVNGWSSDVLGLAILLPALVVLPSGIVWALGEAYAGYAEPKIEHYDPA